YRRAEVILGVSELVLNNVTTIERGIKRINDVYESNPVHLQDFTKQLGIILNIQRSCEASIVLAMHLVSGHKLGIPKQSREAVEILQKSNIIELNLAQSLMNMVGFRNIAIHDYQALNLDILQAIFEKHLNDFKSFTIIVLQHENERS